MLPTEWKAEIQQSIDEAARRNEDSEKRRIESQNAIAAPLDRLANEFVRYKQEQTTADKGKRRREIATIWGVGITGAFTIILAVATIGLYVATHDLVHDAQQTAERQLRAYVSFNTTNPIIVDDSKITFMIDNFGQTPAKDVRIWGSWEFVPFGEDLPADFQFLVKPPCPGDGLPGQKIERGPVTVYPKNPIPAHNFHCPDVAFDLKLAESKKENAFNYGFITYLDIFNERRRSNFCFLYYPAIRTAIFCSRHNEIDPEQHDQ